MLEAAQLLAEVLGPWMTHHALPAALAAGADLAAVLDSALAAVMVRHALSFFCQLLIVFPGLSMNVRWF